MEARYHPFKAIAAAIGNAIPLVIVPVYVLRILPTLLPLELPLDLAGLERTIISIGSVAVLFAALTAFFSRGLAWRAAFGPARQGARLAWIYYVFNGGLFGMDLELFDAGTISFALDFQRLLYILYIAILLMALFFIVEFIVYRRTQREEYYPEEYYQAGF
ncbi:MAG: hypothetical protein ACE5HJ_05950 [Thermoplasmata archaeon]